MPSRVSAWAGLVLGLSLVAVTPALGTLKRYQAPTDAGRVPAAVAVVPSATAASTARKVPVSGDRPAAPRATSSPAREAPVLAVPVVLRIPVLGVHAQIVAVRSSAAGVLAVPEDPRKVGWWTGSATPGAARGTAVLDGHVDTARLGDGVLFHLADLALGAEVDVTSTAGSTRYVVVARRVYSKAALPPQVFDAQGPPRLVLVTCGGPFDTQTHHYADNVVVFATPLSGKEPS